MPVLIGALLGMSTLIFIGPVFFYLLKSSVESGWKAGISVALGIIAGDVICVFLAMMGGEQFINDSEHIFWIALGGGALLVSMGIKYIIWPFIQPERRKKHHAGSILIYFTHGFIINFVNPFVFVVWFGFTTYIREEFSTDRAVWLALSTTLLVIFVTDCLKAVLASKLNRIVRPERMLKWMRVFGVIMLIFGIRLLLYPFF